MKNYIKLLLIPIILLSCITCDALDTSLFINCGLPKSTRSTSPFDGRVWQSDDNPAFAPSNLKTVSTTVAIADADDDLPYKTARVFWSDITYTFSITPGPVFVRLYFFPNLSSNNTPPHLFSTSLFANNFTLLHNFNPSLNSLQETKLYEFQLLLENGENNLNLSFSPGSIINNNTKLSYGYVNGIEIESIPEGLYINESNLKYLYATNPVSEYYLGPDSTAFQTVFRLNVGGENVDTNDDNPGGMKRQWEADEDYVVGERGIKLQPPPGWNNVQINYTKKTPAYAAPKIVYGTRRSMGDNSPDINLPRNITWMFKVDPGFDYVVRLHLCELGANVTGKEQRVMYVYLDRILVDPGLDIWAEAGGTFIPMYKDYVISMPPPPINNNASKVALSLALHPLPRHVIDISLSGLEILKLSDPTRNLAVPNPPYNGSETTSQNQTPKTKSSSRKIVIIIGSVIGGLLLVSVILFALYRRRVQYKKLFTSAKSSSKGQWLPASVQSQSSTATTKANSSRPSLPSDLCRRFSLSEIRVATSDFDEDLVIGIGGFGKVYKGCIDDGATTVAIKRLNPTSKQGEHEFLTEIEMLSRLRHVHLVSLIGYCEDQGEMILVYEYMPRGTLRDHLNYKDAKGKDEIEVLSWKQRLMICIGSARGLDYLHAGAKQLIIHRDVKSTNILLDDKWTAKVSDFGLSKVGPASDTGVAYVSTVVKGSFGYLDPEYYKRGQLTEKSDVFSFGVVLFEVLCARPAINVSLPKEQVNLANWGRACYKKGTLYTIVDPSLSGQIAPECLRKFGEIADMCVRSHRDERPSMTDIVWSLEFALTLQQTAEKNASNVSPMVEVPSDGDDGDGRGGLTNPYKENISQQSSGVGDDTEEFGSNTGSTATTNSTISNYHMDIKSGSVFSEILDPRAR